MLLGIRVHLNSISLQARNLKRYINQLTYAKAQCERRISVLTSGRRGGEGSSGNGEKGEGAPDTAQSTPDLYSSSLQNLPGRKVG